MPGRGGGAAPEEASWEAPDWSRKAPGGWWRVVHKPCVYATSKPINTLLPGGGFDVESWVLIIMKTGRPWWNIFQMHIAGEVLAMAGDRIWDAEHRTHWLRLRDEGDFGEQWIRVNGESLGLGNMIEMLPTGCAPPPLKARLEHCHVLSSPLTGGMHASGSLSVNSQGEFLTGCQASLFVSNAARALFRSHGAGPEAPDSDATRQLLSSGFVVVPGAVPDVAGLVEEMARLDDGFNFHEAPQLTPGQRGDRILWLDEGLAVERFGVPAVSATVAFLKGIADALNPALSRHHAARADAGDPVHSGLPMLPATPEAVLTTPPTVMAACYPGKGARYIPHQDNKYIADAGSRGNQRELTVVLYANPPDWDLERDGGALRIYPNSSGWTKGPATDAPPGKDTPLSQRPPHVVAPTGGSLVVFFSDLWHEVMPAYRERRSLIMWIFRPAEDSESWLPNVF